MTNTEIVIMIMGFLLFFGEALIDKTLREILEELQKDCK